MYILIQERTHSIVNFTVLHKNGTQQYSGTIKARGEILAKTQISLLRSHSVTES